MSRTQLHIEGVNCFSSLKANDDNRGACYAAS